jgi:MFS family permease
LQYGAIDGVYNGIATALLALAGGLLADRSRRYKEVAAGGYGISAICKLLLLLVGGSWGWITAITAIDRVGKGARTAPRDALISLHSTGQSLASAFAVHRALDAGGSLLGPIVAFAVLTALPGAFDAIWVISFAFALLGWAVLWLFIDNPRRGTEHASGALSVRAAVRLLAKPRFRALAGAGALLSMATISDGFLYLLMQQHTGITSGFVPLFYVMTAACYMLLSVPVGYIADSFGRMPVLLSGYGIIGLIYALLVSSTGTGFVTPAICLFLFGLYYAATEGVLMAMASVVIPAELRTSGLAILSTGIGLAKMLSSLLFGWSWQVWGSTVTVAGFATALLTGLLVSAMWLRRTEGEERSQ